MVNPMSGLTFCPWWNDRIPKRETTVMLLKDKDYAVIGRAAQAFNEIEDIVFTFSGTMLGIKEQRIAEEVAGPNRSLSHKIEFLQQLLKRIAEEYPQLTDQVAKTIAILSGIKLLTEERNALV